MVYNWELNKINKTTNQPINPVIPTHYKELQWLKQAIRYLE